MDETVDVRQRTGKRRCIECDPAPLEKRAPSHNQWQLERDFGIVIDAGSSGSRVQIYSWLRHDIARRRREVDGLPLNVLPKVEVGVERGEGWHAKTTPGISTFGSNPAGVDNHLRPLLEHALSVIPQTKVAETPIYLLATAGMRLLPDREREAVLDRACRFIRNNYDFKLGDCAQTVRTITGEEEGLFGWVAVNYLMDGFDSHVHSEESGRAGASTYGFLDMGGASTQIAFEPSPQQRLKHADNLVDVHLRQLDGKDVAHPVFVTTWLGYGTNQARQRFVDVQVSADAKIIAEEQPVSEAEDHLRVIDDPCLPSDLTLSEKRHPGIAFKGTGDFAACVRRQSPLLNKDAPCQDEPCLFAGVHAPPIDFSVNHFIGISEYWYSTQELWSLGGVYDFVSFEKHAARYCARTWDEIRAEHSDGTVQQDRLELQCFKAAWIVNILHEGIGIPRLAIDAGGTGNTREPLVASTAQQKAGEKGLVKPTGAGKPSFQSLDTVGDVAISWTLGKMVLEVSQSVQPGKNLPYAGEALRFPPSWRKRLPLRFEPLHVVFVGGLALLALLLCSSRARKRLFWWRGKRDAYQAADYALVGMEEGGPRMNGSAVSSPRLGGVPATSPRIGLFASKQDPSRPRLLRHALSTPSALGRRVPSGRDRHGRAISTDTEMGPPPSMNGRLSVTNDSSDDDASSSRSISRQASQTSLNTRAPIRTISQRGRTTPSGVMYGEEA